MALVWLVIHFVIFSLVSFQFADENVGETSGSKFSQWFRNQSNSRGSSQNGSRPSSMPSLQDVGMNRKLMNNSSNKLQLHYAIYRLQFYSNSLIHTLWLSNSHNNVASIQKSQGDKSYRVIVAIVESVRINHFLGADCI